MKHYLLKAAQLVGIGAVLGIVVSLISPYEKIMSVTSPVVTTASVRSLSQPVSTSKIVTATLVNGSTAVPTVNLNIHSTK